MSGTIPVNMEQRLLSKLGLKPNTPVVYQSSNRPELTYIIELPLRKQNDLTMLKEAKEMITVTSK